MVLLYSDKLRQPHQSCTPLNPHPRSRPHYPAAHSAVVVSGRKGFASMINGYYIGQTKVLEAGLPTYKSTEKDETGRWRYLFFHSANNAWACAHEIGADDIVAYARGICTRPDQVTTVWIVVSTDGEFVADSNVRCGESSARHSLEFNFVAASIVVECGHRSSSHRLFVCLQDCRQ